VGALYPPIEPFDGGMLDVGDGQLVYWEACGNARGAPAVVLHGGPGSGCTPYHRRLFDPARYRIVLFDQRGCGRSTPHASDIAVDLGANTTRHLVADIDRLRAHLRIDRWLVYGNSWGSTLALAYSQEHLSRVSAIVLLAVTTSRRSEIEWLYHGAGRFHPEAWERFRLAVPPAERDGHLVDAYYRLLQHPDADVRDRAAREWCAWEDAVVAIDSNTPPNPRYDDPRFRMAFARIVTHYFHHHVWLEEGELLRNAGRLYGTPGVLIHGRLDIGSPLRSAWELSRAWPGSELVVLDAGHMASDPGMSEAVVDATDRLATTEGDDP